MPSGYSVLEYQGDGVTTVFAVNFTLGYLNKSDIYCRVGDEVDGSGNPVYRVLEDIPGDPGRMRVLGAVPTASQKVLFRRITAKTTLQNDYADGEALDDDALDNSFKQQLMIAHELLDGFGLETVYADINMAGHFIRNIGVDESDPNSVASIGLMVTARDAALAAQTAAELAQVHAENEAAAALAARIAAQAAQAAADADVVLTHADAASTSADSTATAADRVQTELDRAAADTAASEAAASELAAAASAAAALVSENAAAGSAANLSQAVLDAQAAATLADEHKQNALAYKDASLVSEQAAGVSAAAAAASALQAQTIAALTNVSFAAPDAKPSFVLQPAWDATDPKLTSTRTTAAGRIKRNQTYESVAANIPRLDWDLGKPGWLCEGQRTNYLLQSNDLTSSTWTKWNCTIVADAIAGPWGTMLDKVVENTAAANSHDVLQNNIVIPANKVFTVWCIAKADTRSAFWFNIRDSTLANAFRASFNLATRTVIGPSTTGAGTYISGEIKDIGGGLVRCSITGMIDTTSVLGSVGLYLQAIAGASVYDGDGVSGMYFGPVQFEEGYFPTSYIPTTTSQVTAALEYLTVLPRDIPGWSLDKGTTVIDVVYPPLNPASSVPISDYGTNTSTGCIRIYISGIGELVVKVWTAGVGLGILLKSATQLAAIGVVPGAHVRAAITWNSGLWSTAIGGPLGILYATSVGPQTAPPVDKLLLCGFTNSVSQLQTNKLCGFAFYPQTLSDNELRSLVEV